MDKYNNTENISFYDQLFKSLDEESDDESNLCQITGFSLDSRAVTLECNHKFNYESLYKEICRQKYDFKSYDLGTLNKSDHCKIKKSNLDYFIKCPYCRNIQFAILPYYEELCLEKKYGINSLDSSLPGKPKTNNYLPCDPKNYTFYFNGILFKSGQCCYNVNETFTKTETSVTVLCGHKYVTQIENTDKTYCKYHYKTGIKTIMNEKKKAIKDELKKQKDELMKQKDELLKERKILLDEKNAERLVKGLLPLKRLPMQKIKNIVEQPQQIGKYIEENVEAEEKEEKEEKEENNKQPTIVTGCKTILKTGTNKGSQCGCNKIYIDGLCKRHWVCENKDNIKTK